MSSGGNPAYLDLPNDTLDYFIGWGAGNRIGTILNIANPAATGVSCYTKIPKNGFYKNSNPVFYNLPVTYFCTGRTSYFNNNAFDPDADSLSFSIVQPYNIGNGNTCTNFAAPKPPNYIYTTNPSSNPNGYSFPNAPLGTASSVSINNITGEISVNPAAVGVYILSIAVKEYRKVNNRWKFLCETRREIQIETGNCSVSNSAPYLAAVIPIKNANASLNQNINAGDTLCFNIKFKDADTGDSLFAFPEGPIFNANGDIAPPYAILKKDSATDSLTLSFCWNTAYVHGRVSPYLFTITYRDNKCNSNQKTFMITVKPRITDTVPIANFIASKTIWFVDSTIQFYDLSLRNPTSWLWTISPNKFSFINGSGNTNQNPEIKFNDTGCYSIKLRCQNAGGADSLTRTNYICISYFTGINSVVKSAQIRIYPNPANKLLRIQTPGEFRPGNVIEFVITDVLGRVWSQGKLAGEETVINISSLPRQVYFIRAGDQVLKFLTE